MDQETVSTATTELPPPAVLTAEHSSPSVIKILPSFINEILQTNQSLGQARAQLTELTLARHRTIRQFQLSICFGEADRREAEICKSIDDMAAVMTERLNEIAKAHGVNMEENWIVNLQDMTFVRQASQPS